jgi:protein arginine N-methyltransferase 5
MLTTPITNSHFHSRVLGLLSSYSQAVSDAPPAQAQQPLPLISALENVDTPLTPSETISQLLTFTSSWIDLASPDPVIAYLSRQVFNLEIAYASFCGVVTVVVPGPALTHGANGVSQFARAVKEALSTGSYIQLHVMMPMDVSKAIDGEEDVGSLTRFARPEFVQQKGHGKNTDPFGAWDAWNVIRTMSKYHSRLSVGKYINIMLSSIAVFNLAKPLNDPQG